MLSYTVNPSALSGSIRIPPSKSHTMRAILLASMARGKSVIRGPLPSPDTEAMIAACSLLGADIRRLDGDLAITGTGGQVRRAGQFPGQFPGQFSGQAAVQVSGQVSGQVSDILIDAGNSGQVLRFIAAFAALSAGGVRITGDDSIRTRRPIQPLLSALEQAGASAVSTKGDGYAPVVVKGPARASCVAMDGRDSQPVSAMLMLGAFLNGTTHIRVTEPGELPWVGLTLHWLDKLGIPYTNDGYRNYSVTGPSIPRGFDYTVPGDWSSAAFPLAAALATGSSATLRNLDFDDPQGDKAVVRAMEAMGAEFQKDPASGTLTVVPGAKLRGLDLDINHIIDAAPILAALACFAESPTRLSGAAIARHKECDRLQAIAEELGKMGARIQEQPDGLVIHPAPLHGARTSSRKDHRIAMALAVAGLGARETTCIEDIACVDKSFPDFAGSMRSLGARIQVLHGGE